MAGAEVRITAHAGDLSASVQAVVMHPGRLRRDNGPSDARGVIGFTRHGKETCRRPVRVVCHEVIRGQATHGLRKATRFLAAAIALDAALPLMLQAQPPPSLALDARIRVTTRASATDVLCEPFVMRGVRCAYDRPTHRFAGRFRGVDGAGLFGVPDRLADSVQVRFTDLERLEFAEGYRSKARLGVLVGGLAGLAVGIALAKTVDFDCGWIDAGCGLSEGYLALAFVAGGTGLGAGIGALIGRDIRSEAWWPIPDPAALRIVAFAR